MGNLTQTDKEIEAMYGRRKEGTPIFSPQEIGYRCPKGHSNIDWSEFQKHIWCYTCEMDFYYAFCFLIKDKHNPKDLDPSPFIIEGISVFKEDGNSFNDIPIELLGGEPIATIEPSELKELLELNHRFQAMSIITMGLGRETPADRAREKLGKFMDGLGKKYGYAPLTHCVHPATGEVRELTEEEMS